MNIQNRKTSVFAYGPATRMYFSARTEGRISYGHLGRTNSCSNVYFTLQLAMKCSSLGNGAGNAFHVDGQATAELRNGLSVNSLIWLVNVSY